MSKLRKRVALFAAVLVGIGYLSAVGQAYFFAKAADERAVAMLSQVRLRLAELGVSNPQKNVGLEFGYYAGCRVWLLEHLFVDGCLGFRMGEEIRAQAEPEQIRQIVQDICIASSGDCPYRGYFVLSARYFKVARTFSDSSSTTVVREQSGDLSRYWIKGDK